MPSTVELRATVADLEAAARDAGNRLIQAEADHQRAMRAAVAANSAEGYASLTPTEAELTNARAASDRVNSALAAARTMLAEAIKAEREAAQEAARRDVEARIEAMQKLASEADAAFADLCDRLQQLQRAEIEARAVVRTAFGVAPASTPQALTVTPALASHLRNMGNGLTPAAQPWTSEALRNSAHRIRLACVPE